MEVLYNKFYHYLQNYPDRMLLSGAADLFDPMFIQKQPSKLTKQVTGI